MNTKLKTLILVAGIITPLTSTQAKLSDELNSLIESFFGEKTETSDQPEKKSSPLPKLNFKLPENPTTEDLSDLEQKIKRQEAELASVEASLQKNQSRVQDLDQQQDQLQSQITILDQELSITNRKLSLLIAQEQQWKRTLENITREKHKTSSHLRATQQSWQHNMNKKIVRSETFGFSGDSSLIQWIFSPKTVSQILEQKQSTRHTLSSQERTLYRLQTEQKNLAGQERRAAFLLAHGAHLRKQIGEQQSLLQQFTHQKSTLLAQLQHETGQQQKTQLTYQAQQEEKRLYLKSLQLGQKKLRQKLNPNQLMGEHKNALDAPLEGELKITAAFHDPAYEEVLKQKHEGVDFEAAPKSPVLAAHKGRVKKVTQPGLDYSYIILDHGEGLYSIYGHLSEILVVEEQEVQQGDKIALSGGNPGSEGAGAFTTGPHLHFEVFHNGEYQDPLQYIQP